MLDILTTRVRVKFLATGTGRVENFCNRSLLPNLYGYRDRCVVWVIYTRNPLFRATVKILFTSKRLLLSVRLSVCLSVAYIANNSRTQRPRVSKFGRKVPHLWCDSHTSFKVKRSPGPLMLTHTVHHIFRTARPTNFKLTARMEEIFTFLTFNMAAAAILDFHDKWIWYTFRHDNCMFLELCMYKIWFIYLVRPICFCFYRAMRMHARTVPWQDVRLSVCLSHAGILSKRLSLNYR